MAGTALLIGYESALQLLGSNPRGAESSSRRDWWEWAYSARRLRVLFNEDGRIRSLSTTSDHYRTERTSGWVERAPTSPQVPQRRVPGSGHDDAFVRARGRPGSYHGLPHP